jgi:ATP synthase protein I
MSTIPPASPDSPPPPKPDSAGSIARQFASAMELPYAFVGCVVVGGAIGYFLDRWLKTAPFGMLILGAIGFAAGVREILRRTRPKKDG